MTPTRTAAIVRHGDSRVSTTPNSTMTTLASPTLGGAATSLWRVDMPAGVVGPVYAFDGEVLWAVLDGTATLVVDDAEHQLGPGDTAVIAASAMRRLVAGPSGFVAIATTAGPGEVTREDGTRAGVPPWVS